MLKWHGENKTWVEKESDYPDPLLADLGVADARALARKTASLPVDYVGSSRLMRTMETAHLLFPHHEVHVWPHLDEMDDKDQFRSTCAEDLPLTNAEQDEILTKQWGNASWIIRDSRWHDPGLISVERFLREVVPTLPQQAKLRLAAVTHSDTMRYDPFLQRHLATGHVEPILPWANSVQAFQLTFDFSKPDIRLVEQPKALWKGFHQKYDMLNCSQTLRCDSNFMAHVRDGSGHPCSRASDNIVMV
jgi:broad specificity phosphatase PhoE